MQQIKVLSLIILSMIVMASCKKKEVVPTGVEITKPSSGVHVASPSVIEIEAKLSVADKIDKLVIEEKINEGTPRIIVDKGFSSTTNADTYTDSYQVPSGLAAGTKITLLFTLSDKAGNKYNSSTVLHVH